MVFVISIWEGRTFRLSKSEKSEFPNFLQRAPCGHRAGTVRAPCGHRAGTAGTLVCCRPRPKTNLSVILLTRCLADLGTKSAPELPFVGLELGFCCALGRLPLLPDPRHSVCGSTARPCRSPARRTLQARRGKTYTEREHRFSSQRRRVTLTSLLPRATVMPACFSGG